MFGGCLEGMWKALGRFDYQFINGGGGHTITPPWLIKALAGPQSAGSGFPSGLGVGQRIGDPGSLGGRIADSNHAEWLQRIRGWQGEARGRGGSPLPLNSPATPESAGATRPG